MNNRHFHIALLLGTSITIGASAWAVDPAKQDTAATQSAEAKKPEQHIMMDHSPGDQKSMQHMKDKQVKVHTTGDAPSANASKPGTEHIMMDHSRGDQKSMQRMKDKQVKTHVAGQAASADANKPCEEHILMDHSPGDSKSMQQMKDKTLKTHASGNCAQANEAPSKAAAKN